MTPITKNGSDSIRVFDVHGNELEATYPKRAKGLVRKGRAQWLGSVNHDDPDFVPDSIILYDNADWNSSPAEPADHVPRTADIQHHTEVQSMFNNEINNNEYIPEINNTTGIPENAEEIDPAVQKMLEDLSAHITKTSEETEKQRLEMAKVQEEANIAATKARMEMEKQRREADGDAAIPDFGEIPEIPADAGSVDFQNLLGGILDTLDSIGAKELSDDIDIAAVETGHLHDLSETLRDIYHKTLNVRKETAQIAAYTQKQKLLAERIAKLEEEKSMMLRTIGKIFEEEQLGGNQFIYHINDTTRYYNDEINKLIAMMN